MFAMFSAIFEQHSSPVPLTHFFPPPFLLGKDFRAKPFAFPLPVPFQFLFQFVLPAGWGNEIEMEKPNPKCLPNIYLLNSSVMFRRPGKKNQKVYGTQMAGV